MHVQVRLTMPRTECGLEIRRVHRIFDTHGRLFSAGMGTRTREYGTCSRFGLVLISHRSKRVVHRTGSFQ